MMRTLVNLHEEYERWDNAHKKMTDVPPSEGRRYIQHALTLLELLGPITEIHPVAKAVIGCFTQLVLFEHDRRENDARVAAVILAQTGMMRVLLDIDSLAARQNSTSTLKSMVKLPQMLHIVQEDIMTCYNNIDTYYKEHRLVKFCKAKDWKAKMLEFIQIFDKHRVELHQTLSLKVASDVSDLVSKMDTLLERLFLPHEPWELVISSQIRKLDMSGQADWMKDTQILQSLAIATGDPSAKLEMQLDQMKEDLHLSIDVLSQRNTELFALKMKLHTEQLERVILHSTRLVIGSLSGPHDRLEHKDLREIWKEMKWMSCVETKVFGIALFEYYLNLYSNGASTPGFDAGLWMPRFNPVNRYKAGSFKHPQAWTLLYLFVYAEKISNVIDSDSSGFIRISEVNLFTSQIPEGWTLPQWCAYLVEGQFHEYAIYRKRLTHIRNILHELHAEILPNNRFSSAEFVFGIGAMLLHYLVLQPRGPDNQSKVAIAPALHELVKAKILAQDAKFREMLQSINWIIEDESTIEVLSNGRPLETYIFPLLLVLMEFWLDLHHLCKSEVLDLKEWIGPYLGILALRSMTETHIKLLQKKFECDKDTKSAEELRTYHRGTWALLQKTHEYDLSHARDRFDIDLVPLLKEDYDNFYSDLSFLDEFPLPEPTGLLLQKKYSTWDEYKRDKGLLVPSERQPITWHPIDDKMNTDDKNKYVDLPVSLWICDKCDKGSRVERDLHCFDCRDFDFCRDCYFSCPPAEHTVESHDFSHIMLVRAAWCQPTRIIWLGFIAREKTKNVLDKVKTTLCLKQRTDGEATQSEPPEEDFQCQRCMDPIVYGQRPFYVCVEYSCHHKDLMLCDSCAWTNDYPEGTSHRWWHTLLPLASRDHGDECVSAQSLPPASFLSTSQIDDPNFMANSNTTKVSATPSSMLPAVDASFSFSDPSLVSAITESVQNLDDRVSNLERKVGVSQVGVEERLNTLEMKMVSIEAKLDGLLGELQKAMLKAILLFSIFVFCWSFFQLK